MEAKSQVQWLKEGDSNTNYFHHIASTRRNMNYIHPLVDDCGSEVRPEGINNHIASFFMKLYKDPKGDPS